MAKTKDSKWQLANAFLKTQLDLKKFDTDLHAFMERKASTQTTQSTSASC